MISLTIHNVDEAPIKARAFQHNTTSWIEIDFGDHRLTVFLPIDRAERLAAAITAAGAVPEPAKEPA